MLNVATSVVDLHANGHTKEINWFWITVLVPAVAFGVLRLAGLSGGEAFLGSLAACIATFLVALGTADYVFAGSENRPKTENDE